MNDGLCVMTMSAAASRCRLRCVLLLTPGVLLAGCEKGVTPSLPPTHAVFDVQPAASVTSTQPLGAVRILLLDAEGRTSRSGAMVTMELSSADPEAHLLGTKTANASDGVATFSDLNVARAGTGFRLVAKVTGLDDAVSRAFDVVPGAATHLRITYNGISANVYPRCVPGPLPFTVWVTDAAGNLVSSATSSVTIGLTRTAAFGLTVSTDDGVYGTTTRTAVAGVAEFDDLSVHRSGAYTISATGGGLVPATASGFVGGCDMDRLVFLRQPSDGTAGAALGTFSVLRVDAYGNATSEQHSPGPSYSVTIALGSNPAGAVLSGTQTVMGPGTSSRDFSDISIDKPGTGYTLVARSSTTGTQLTGTSAPFTIR